MSAPSAFRLEQAMSALMEKRDQLLREYPEMADDDRLLSDMLDGESGDAMEVIDRVIRAAIEADMLAKGAKERRNEIAERQARFERRRDNLRAMAFAAFEAIGMSKREAPDFTASIRAGTASVVITDEKLLPEALIRVKREPDKTLIGAALKNGREVPGATLSNPMPTIAIRTK